MKDLRESLRGRRKDRYKNGCNERSIYYHPQKGSHSCTKKKRIKMLLKLEKNMLDIKIDPKRRGIST